MDFEQLRLEGKALRIEKLKKQEDSDNKGEFDKEVKMYPPAEDMKAKLENEIFIINKRINEINTLLYGVKDSI